MQDKQLHKNKRARENDTKYTITKHTHGANHTTRRNNKETITITIKTNQTNTRQTHHKKKKENNNNDDTHKHKANNITNKKKQREQQQR